MCIITHLLKVYILQDSHTTRIYVIDFYQQHIYGVVRLKLHAGISETLFERFFFLFVFYISCLIRLDKEEQTLNSFRNELTEYFMVITQPGIRYIIRDKIV